MDSIIEVQRQTHEEVERFEHALYTLLSRPQPTHEARIQTEHKAAQVLDRISAKTSVLCSLYQDEDSRKHELDVLSATAPANDLSEFYSRLVKIQEHHAKYPDSIPGGFDLELAAFLEEIDTDNADEDYEYEDRAFFLWFWPSFAVEAPFQLSRCCFQEKRDMGNTLTFMRTIRLIIT